MISILKRRTETGLTHFVQTRIHRLPLSVHDIDTLKHQLKYYLDNWKQNLRNDLDREDRLEWNLQMDCVQPIDGIQSLWIQTIRWNSCKAYPFYRFTKLETHKSFRSRSINPCGFSVLWIVFDRNHQQNENAKWESFCWCFINFIWKREWNLWFSMVWFCLLRMESLIPFSLSISFEKEIGMTFTQK